MAANTNSSALIRLRPLQNTNTGAIVEEHIRYWQKYKDDADAAQRADAAKRREFQRKLNKDTFEFYEGIQPEENAGFLNAQIIDNFEKNKPYYVQLAKAAANGDVDAMVKLADEKRKIESAVSVNKVYSEKIQALEEQKAKGEFNDVLDTGLDRFKNSLVTGKYRFNPDWSLDIYDPNQDQLVRLNSSQLFNNDFLNSKFNKKAQFVENGQNIASNLLDNEDGNKQITENTRLDGIRLVRSLFGEDVVEARTWYGNAKRNGLINIETPFSQLSEAEKNRLAETYYEQNVAPNLQEVTVDDTLDDALKRQRLSNARLDAQKKRQDIAEGNREADETRTTISASTDEQGNELVISSLKDAQGNDLATEQAKVFNLNGKPITFGVKGNSNTNKTYSSLVRTDNGDIFAIGQEVVKENVPLFNDDGTPQVDSNGNQKTVAREKAVPIVETDKKVLNNISRNIENKDGEKLKNLSELDVLMSGLQKEVKPSETPEERRARLRKQAGL